MHGLGLVTPRDTRHRFPSLPRHFFVAPLMAGCGAPNVRMLHGFGRSRPWPVLVSARSDGFGVDYGALDGGRRVCLFVVVLRCDHCARRLRRGRAVLKRVECTVLGPISFPFGFKEGGAILAHPSLQLRPIARYPTHNPSLRSCVLPSARSPNRCTLPPGTGFPHVCAGTPRDRVATSSPCDARGQVAAERQSLLAFSSIQHGRCDAGWISGTPDRARSGARARARTHANAHKQRQGDRPA